MASQDTPVGTGPAIEAAILDLDGVITRTASVHERAWAESFDPLLEREGQAPFSHDDYLRYVDGKPRFDGVRSFLASRDIGRPEGAPGDPPGYASVVAIGTLKDERFNELLAEGGVQVFEDAVLRLHDWRNAGLRTAIVTSSRNGRAVLDAAKLTSLFEARVDGEVGPERGLAGKPAPDYFVEAARMLGVPPALGMVVEDAISGVTAGRRGAFGLVVGVAREGDPDALLAAGADVAVRQLTEIGVRPRAIERSEPRASGAAPQRMSER